MGLICRLRDTRGQLWRPSCRAEQCPTHRHLAQIALSTRVRQPPAMHWLNYERHNEGESHSKSS